MSRGDITCNYKPCNGYVQYIWFYDDKGSLDVLVSNLIKLEYIVVRVEYRRCGIGTALLRELDKLAFDLQCDIQGCVYKPDSDLIEFYHKCGYTFIEPQKIYKSFKNIKLDNRPYAVPIEELSDSESDSCCKF